jgi:hypothetical protein
MTDNIWVLSQIWIEIRIHANDKETSGMITLPNKKIADFLAAMKADIKQSSQRTEVHSFQMGVLEYK